MVEALAPFWYCESFPLRPQLKTDNAKNRRAHSMANGIAALRFVNITSP
jgi:hypothetical protein